MPGSVFVHKHYFPCVQEDPHKIVSEVKGWSAHNEYMVV